MTGAEGTPRRLTGLVDASPGHYPPAPDNRAAMISSGMIVLDTNVLLSLYRLTPTARHQLLDLLRSLEDRLFVPHQVALEYERNRITAIRAQGRFFQDVRKQIAGAASNLEQQAKAVGKQCGAGTEHVAKVNAALETATSAIEALALSVEALRENQDVRLPGAVNDDPVRNSLVQLLEGRVGPAPTPEHLSELHALAKKRFESSTPPGYLDKDKETNPYGDFILWSQTLDEAASRKLPVVLVSGDTKPDWVNRDDDLVLGPQPDLIVEMRSQAGVAFCLLNIEDFLVEARQALSSEVSDETVAEVREAATDQVRLFVSHANDDHLAGDEALAALRSFLAGRESDVERRSTLSPLAEVDDRQLHAMKAANAQEIEDLESLADDDYDPDARDGRLADLGVQQERLDAELVRRSAMRVLRRKLLREQGGVD